MSLRLNSANTRWISKLLLLAILLMAAAFIFAQQKKDKPSSPPPQHNNAPSKPPAQNAPRPNNAGPGGGRGNAPAQNNNMSRGGGNNMGGPNNRGGNQAGGMNRNNAGGQNGNSRGPNNANGMNNRGGANNNNARGGMNNNNNRGGMNNNNNRGGANNNARGGPNGGNRGGANVARKGPPTTTREIKTRSGGSVQASYRGGKVRSIQAHNMRIEHGVHGQRRVVAEHNGRRIVAMGRHGGYSQRAYYSRNGRTYVQRTYYVGGRRYAYAYRSYYYGGYTYYGYAPAYYYHPVYYGWAYNPWPAPAYYSWGYYNDPWYGYYGYYYRPYPVYPAASLWLTDYLIAESLRAAYEASNSGLKVPSLIDNRPLNASLLSNDPLINANLMPNSAELLAIPADAAGQAQLSPDVKNAIAEEVKSQIGAEKSAAETKSDSAGGDSNAPPAALDPSHHLFVVNSDVDATTDEGEDCSLSAGDVIYRTGDTPDDDKDVGATVKSSKKDDCKVGASISVAVDDLQEMHNHLRETLDSGLKELADKQGKNGLPAAPDTGTSSGEVPAPTADSNVSNDLDQAQKDADQTEADVNSSGNGGQ